MLYNRNWGKQYPDRSLESFAAWLETKNPNATYRYHDTENCAHAQYMRHIGKEYVTLGNLFRPSWHRIENLSSYGPHPENRAERVAQLRTFGELLRHTRAKIKERATC